MSKKAELSVAGQFTEENIPNLLAAIDAKIKEITGDKDKANYVAIEIMGNKISDVKDPMKLRELYAYISKKEQSVHEFDPVFNQAALGVKLPTYKENGATVKQCQEAILTRFKEVTHEETLNKLKETKKALEECLSEEAKKKAKLQNAGQSLANLLKIEL